MLYALRFTFYFFDLMNTYSTKTTPIPSPFPTVLLFGRTNVGKSTLFNKLTGKSQAMVSKIAGTTRDSNVGIVEWRGEKFQLIDAGGILDTKFLRGKGKLKKLKLAKDNIDNLVQLQVKKHLKQAELILFLVDAREGLMEQDREMAILLKRLTKKTPVLLIANKCDNSKQHRETAEFYRLSLGDPLPISAATGSGTGDMLDIICKQLKKTRSNKDLLHQDLSDQAINVIILGRPNAGKSTLLNAIAGENRVIVSPFPHTTREPNDITARYQKQQLTFIDTAGIIKAKSKKTKEEFIKLGIAKTRKALKKADVALLVLDISEPLSHLEIKLADEILAAEASIILVANKWDKAEKKDVRQYTRYIKSRLGFASWAPIAFLSAKNKTKIRQLLDLIITASAARNKAISEDELREFLSSATRHAAPLANTKIRGIFKRKLAKPKLIELTQTKTNPPEFALRIKSKFGLKDNYVKYLENRLREKFGLIGTPIMLKIKSKK